MVESSDIASSRNTGPLGTPGASDLAFRGDNPGPEGDSAEERRQGEMPNSKRDSARSGSARPRRSRSNPSRRPSAHTSQAPPGATHPETSTRTQQNENTQNLSAPQFVAQTHHFPRSVGVGYTQGSGFATPYTMSAQQSPMTMSHPTHSYAFTPSYHHPMVLESGMMPQNTHANYQHMVQSHTPVYTYQRPSPDGAPPSHHSFQNAPSPVYTTHSSSSPATPHLPPSSSQGGSLSPSYGSSGAFQSLQYPSTVVLPTYHYSPQVYSSSPMYQPQYGAPSFGQQNEPPLAWYYFPPSPQPYDPGPSYQGHYAVGYTQASHSVQETTGNPSSRSPNPNQSRTYLSPPSATSSRHADARRAGDTSPSSAGAPPRSEYFDDHLVSSQGGTQQAVSDRPLVRRSFHPNPPAHRSEFVMWVGNVPTDATHDEIWRFFISSPEGNQESSTNGVVSVFLISRSNCAFINYQNAEDLHSAIARFNGVQLRPEDPKCPRLVCRARRTDDDLKAGVGHQRGMGMHTKWIRDQKSLQAAEYAAVDGAASSSGTFGRLERAISTISLSSDDSKKGPPEHTSSSDSYSSTNSSFLARYFPTRYFILKSLSKDDLDISVARGVWATQKHNEEILDQAFRTSKDVYLIFGVNRSREFYGYARMAGPVLRGQHDVQWSSRSPPPADSSRLAHFLSPSDNRFVDGSPAPADEASPTGSTHPQGAHERHTAPAMLGQAYRKPTVPTPVTKQESLDHQRSLINRTHSERFALDSSAPSRAIRGGNQVGQGKGESQAPPLGWLHEEETDIVEVEEEFFDLMTPIIQPGEHGQRGEVSWGDSFAVEWMSTVRLSFNATRHLRNPWNRDKEIKVSRDGTELEPSVGRQLLEEWPIAPEAGQTPAVSSRTPGPAGRGTASRSGYPFPPVEENEPAVTEDAPAPQ